MMMWRQGLEEPQRGAGPSPSPSGASAELGAFVQAVHPHVLDHIRDHSGLTGAAEVLQTGQPAGGGGEGKDLPKPVRLHGSPRCRVRMAARGLGPAAPWLPHPTLSAALGLVSVCCAPSPVAPPKPRPALPSATELPQGGSWAHHLQVPAGARLPLPVARVCQGALAAALWCIHLVSFL